MKVLNWLKDRFHITNNVDATYPSIKVIVQIGEISLSADSVETLKELMKLMPPSNQEKQT